MGLDSTMILSASGWRKVFAISQNEQDATPDISNDDYNIAMVAADCFVEYLYTKLDIENPVIAVGMDARPTGPKIAEAVINILTAKKAVIQFLGVTAAPEIMAYARKLDGFIYISASHNPIGHNGIKFGTNDGGVLNAAENAIVTADFRKKINDDEYIAAIKYLIDNQKNSEIKHVWDDEATAKHNAVKAYYDFMNVTITDSKDEEEQKQIFSFIHKAIASNSVGIVCDFNGSARTVSIDKGYFKAHNINFYSINDKPGQIVHEIIPEAENLVHVAAQMEKLYKEGHKEVVLGYMPDCDGDRGNIVYWDEKLKQAVILKAQEVFSLSVLAEVTYQIWKHNHTEKDSGKITKDFKPAVCVNCPTSMRIEEIVHTLGGQVFRAEVGEANVVNCAREHRDMGYDVRILGEGSNGGTITYPSAVRDPLNTIFAIIKLLSIREDGLYEIWCKKAGIEYKKDFTLSDILETLPKYTTTGVSEPRAVLHINTTDHTVLKGNFQKVFIKQWNEKQSELVKKFNICSWEGIITNGTKETREVKDFSLSGKGGLKVLFKDAKDEPVAYIWMRGSGTEPVFRIMCDVKGQKPQVEKDLLAWETEMLQLADKM